MLAFDGDAPVGLVNCIEGFSTFACKPLVNVHDVAVLSSHRGRGIAEHIGAGIGGGRRQRGPGPQLPGQRQRLGIARAVYKKPQILFLDEATSHLDLESEQKIRDSLHKFFQQVTAVVIAHRLTTIKEMDRIIVIEKGELLEAGTFEELYAKRGRFYELWEKQKL